jgi:hypothetical protein
MKNSIKKFVLACAAVTAVTAVSATAMAADLGKDAYDATTNSVAVTLPTGIDTTKEATVLVLSGKSITDEFTEADILYVNQETGGDFDGDETAGTETLKLLGENALADGTYTVAIGYYKDGAFAIQEDTFTLGEAPTPAYTKGDVDNNTRINASDAVMIINAFNGDVELTDTQKLAADVDGNERINASDAVAIINYFNNGSWD